MILIGGSPAPIDSSSLSMTEKQILADIQRSPVTYNYNSMEELIFELRLRAGTIKSALDLGKSGATFATLRKSKANPMFWIRTEQGGFQQRPGVAPADAIRDIFYNGRLYAFECASAVIIILYKAVLDLIGDELFNRYFNNLLLMTTNTDRDLGLTTIKTTTEMFPGDILYFNNPDYDRNKPEWAGENVIKVGKNAYFGHGIGVNPAEGIIAELNRLRRRWPRRSAYLLDQATHPNYAYLYSLTTGGNAIPFQSRRDIPVGQGPQVVRIGERIGPDHAISFR